MATVFAYLRMNSAAIYPLLYRPVLCGRCIRHLATRSPQGEEAVELETFEGPIPREKLTISFSKSSGPGGQNVNKLNTKVEVRFHVNSADWLPQRVKDRLTTMFRSRVTKEGELIVMSQEHRTQHRNMETAIDKLEVMVEEAAEVPRGPSELTLARIRLLKKKAQHRKRVEKKYHSEKKHDRRNNFD